MVAEYYNNTLGIEAGWLIESGVMTDVQYKHAVSRKQFNIIRRGCRNTPALVAYDAMPERFKREITKKLDKSPYEVVEVNQLEAFIEDDQKISDFFETYKLADGRNLPKQTRHEYYINAIILEAIHRLIVDKKARHAALGQKTTRIWERISDSVMSLDRVRYPHTLPNVDRRLEGRYKRYRKEGSSSLIHGNFLNKNAGKVVEDVQESMIMMLLSDPRNLDNAQVAKLYNMMAEQMGWQKITEGTVAVWREKMDTDIYARRRGLNAFRNTKTMQVKRFAPTHPLYYLTLDGWDVELLYQATYTNKKGYSTTTYTNRVSVVVVLDPCVKYPLGYAVGTNECPDLIKAALRNAAQQTKKLFGQMYRAHQIQSDRYQIKNMMPSYGTLGEKVTPARAKNAKAKVIEPYFKYINKTYCQMQRNWSGFGITSNKDKQANSDYLDTIKKDFPDYDGVCAQVSAMIEQERAKRHDAYMAMWAETEETDRLPMPMDQYLLKFGATTGNRIMLRGTGIQPTIAGQRRDYDCFDIEFRRHGSVHWEVRYDPEDLSHVLVVNEDETLQFILEEKHVQPMALADRRPGDSDELQRVREYNKALETSVAERISGAQQTVQEWSKTLPAAAAETLNKLLITDSHGQHKDERSRARKAIPVEFEDDSLQFENERQSYIREKVDVSKYLDD